MAHAANNRRITIESDPPGAAVHHLKGFRSEHIGETPLSRSIPVQSENTVIRISIERSGYERRVIELTSEDSLVSVRLVEIPFASAAAHFDDPGLESIAREAYQLSRIRDDLLAALAPWAPIKPAER